MFKTIVVLASLAAVPLVSAAPRSVIRPRDAPTDNDVLNFALSLEHLENAFYTEGLDKFTDQDFVDAGYLPWVRGRFEQIAEHEATHVQFLTSILGDQAVQPCNYVFNLDSPQTFATMSMIFETVGASAYLGGASLIQNKDYLTAAGSILAVEARQAGWVNSAVLKLEAWNGPFDIPITPSAAFSLAEPFLRDCPTTSPLVQTFPTLTLSNGFPVSGSQISVTYDRGQDASGQSFVAWLHGLDVTYSSIDANGVTTVPADLLGTVYAVVVSSQETPSDANMLSGFAIAQFPFSSYARGDA